MTQRSFNWQHLDEVIKEVQQLNEQGYTAQGKWDLTQILEHLHIVMAASMEGFPFRLPRIVAWIVKVTGQKKKYFTTRRFPQGLPAPRKLQPRASSHRTQDEAHTVAEFVAVVERFKAHTNPMQRSPIFGVLDHEQWTELHLIHAMHHLGFLTPTK